jgi:hypothetical protein
MSRKSMPAGFDPLGGNRFSEKGHTTTYESGAHPDST